MANETEDRCPDTPTGEHEWWYQPPSPFLRLFGDNRGYWYCNYRDENGQCRARTYSKPTGWPRAAVAGEAS